MTSQNKKFSLQELISEDSKTMTFGIQKELDRTKKGDRERLLLLRSLLESHEHTLRLLQKLDRKLDEVLQK